MAASMKDDDDGLVSGINVTPLVDITLVLLIIFMVTAKLIDSRAIPMNLPEAAQGHVVQTLFGIELYESGKSSIDGKPIPSDEAILDRAAEARAKDAQLRVVLRAEKLVPHGRVVHVLDLLSQAKIEKIAFGTSPLPIASSATKPSTPPSP